MSSHPRGSGATEVTLLVAEGETAARIAAEANEARAHAVEPTPTPRRSSVGCLPARGRHVVTVLRDELSLEGTTLTPHGGEIQAALLALAVELAT